MADGNPSRPPENAATPSTPRELQAASQSPHSPEGIASTQNAADEAFDPVERHISRKGRTATVDTISSVVSSTSSRLRSASVKLLQADAPLGMWAASSTAAAKAPSIGEIRRGHFGEEGWGGEEAGQRRRASVASTISDEGQRDGQGPGRTKRWMGRRQSSGYSAGPATGTEQFPSLEEEPTLESAGRHDVVETTPTRDIGTEEKIQQQRKAGTEAKQPPSVAEESLPSFLHRDASGYINPPKLPWTTSTVIGLKGFWKWFLTPMGFFITIYGLNVVAWGGMLFLLLCNASPAMCHPTCDDIDSPRRKWIEVDSQILNALFCVTGFGLAPWRFRDLWWLMVYRLGIRGRSAQQRQVGLRRLGGIHRGWFRLPGSDNLGPHIDVPTKGEEPIMVDNPAIPIPANKAPEDPLTGVRAPPTKLWKMDFVIWCNVWNTFLQCCLCGFMWALNRFNRPSWATGLFIALASVVAGVAGIMMFVEGKKVKRVEGIPVKPAVEKALFEMEKHDIEKHGGSERTKNTENHGAPAAHAGLPKSDRSEEITDG